MATYEIVLDQGGNVGLKCPVCNQARWIVDFDVKDWATGVDCPNCVEIKADGSLATENENYYPDAIAAAQTEFDDATALLSTQQTDALSLSGEALFTKEQEIERQRQVVDTTEARLAFLTQAFVVAGNRFGF